MENVKGKIENGRAVLALSGHIDSTNAPAVEAAVFELLGGMTYDGITVDAEELAYISSAGLRILLKLIKTCRDTEVVNVSSDVYEILEVTGFSEMVTVKKAYRRVDITGCEAIAQGANGKVYRLDPETIIKVYLNPDSLPDIHRERELARCAFVHGVPTAISYDVVKVDEGYGSVFELLNARSLAKMLTQDSTDMDTCVTYYVELLKQIHASELKPGEMPDMKAVAVDWAEFMRDYMPADKAEKLVALVKAVPERNTMIHGDYHIRNVMIQDGEPLLIDMDTLSMGHPIFELASMYLAYKGFGIVDPAVVEKFLGLSFADSVKFWEKSLAGYLGTEDEAVIRSVEDKASVVGLTRLARRTIRRKGLETEEGRKLISACTNRLCELVDTIDTLEF